MTSVSQDPLAPTSSSLTMPTAPVKRRLRDMALPTSKRTKISYGFHETQPMNTEKFNISSLGKAATGIKPNKKTTIASTESHKVSMDLKIKSRILQHTRLNTRSPSISNYRHTTPSSYLSSYKSIAKVNKKYGCKLCWRRFQLKTHAYRHKQKAHRVQKAPMQCTNCSCVFEDLIDNGPWNDCCMISIRKYFMLRTLL